MPNYLYVYHGGGAPQGEEAQAAAMKAWMDWFGAIGESVVDGGNPVGMSSTVLAGGNVVGNGGSNPASGYSVVSAADLDAAIAMAKGCPMVVDGSGSVEVAQIIEMG